MERDLIYDVGMFDGSDTAFYLSKGFRVVAVEANPAFCDRARERFRQDVAQKRLTIVDKAIAPAPGKIEFGIHRVNKEWSSCEPGRIGYQRAEMDMIEVECVRLDNLVRDHGMPYYIKIDIEQGELGAVESLRTLSEFPQYVSAEASSVEIVDRLFDFGYRRFMLVGQGSPTIRRRYITRGEGKAVKPNFGSTHSGPFGRDLPGKWVSRDEVRSQYRSLVETGKLTWHDFHAALAPANGVFRRLFRS
jgi:FkbM family methyltransferase